MSYLYFCNEDWTVSKDESKVMCGEVVIADVHGSNNAAYPEETQGANARLIAEAPFMYRLLCSISRVQRLFSSKGQDDFMENAIDEIKKLRERTECEYTTRLRGNYKRLEQGTRAHETEND